MHLRQWFSIRVHQNHLEYKIQIPGAGPRISDLAGVRERPETAFLTCSCVVWMMLILTLGITDLENVFSSSKETLKIPQRCLFVSWLNNPNFYDFSFYSSASPPSHHPNFLLLACPACLSLTEFQGARLAI